MAHATEENPSMPRRKILLSTGAQNYRPPLERSKSAPKLFAIEEMVDEEDEEDLNDEDRSKRQAQRSQKEIIRACCKEDHLYPSITLGRRRCRRGHSIRRPRLYGDMNVQQNTQPKLTNIKSAPAGISTKESIQRDTKLPDEPKNQIISQPICDEKTNGSDEDFENFLLNQNYNANEYLTGDMISYFDRKLNDSAAPENIVHDSVTVSMSDLLNSNDYVLQDHQRNSISMNDLNNFHYNFESYEDESDVSSQKTQFHQDLVLETLIRQSQDNFGEFNSPNESITSNECRAANINECRNMFILKVPFICNDDTDSMSSDVVSTIQLKNVENSILNECDIDAPEKVRQEDIACTSTNNVDDMDKSSDQFVFRSGSVLDRVRNFELMASGRLNRELNNNVATSKSLTNFKKNQANLLITNNRELNLARRLTPVENLMADGRDKNRDDESEMSDESGFVEFQDLSLKSVYA